MKHVPSLFSPPNTAELTPSQLGYRMPAEWESHLATWLSWPHNTETWPEELEQAERTLARVVQALHGREQVFINVNDFEHREHARQTIQTFTPDDHVTYWTIPTDDAWVRDHGAIFVLHRQSGALAATCWGFNSWGEKYPPWNLDNEVASKMAQVMGLPVFDGGMILEGGSIEVNGAGLLLTTEKCLLNPNRNPSLTKEEIEQKLREYLGARAVLWLEDGIRGDDTDGHIDDLARFVAHDHIVTVVEDDPADDNYGVLRDNYDRLRRLSDLDGRPLNISTLPMPAPVIIRGERMPATYANYYIANGAVLMPAYNDPNDSRAQAILQTLFPDREVIPIDCTEVIWGLGALHCLTQQVPRQV